MLATPFLALLRERRNLLGDLDKQMKNVFPVFKVLCSLLRVVCPPPQLLKYRPRPWTPSLIPVALPAPPPGASSLLERALGNSFLPENFLDSLPMFPGNTALSPAPSSARRGELGSQTVYEDRRHWQEGSIHIYQTP